MHIHKYNLNKKAETVCLGDVSWISPFHHEKEVLWVRLSSQPDLTIVKSKQNTNAYLQHWRNPYFDMNVNL